MKPMAPRPPPGGPAGERTRQRPCNTSGAGCGGGAVTACALIGLSYPLYALLNGELLPGAG
ncbi:hypothetical protein ABZW32_38655, partial [Streptomyces sp. NPDC004667]|uniref:hypothetical protein n=1 Tax=Streptomyces sp. NPDC004667 TaxID=3154285 RepID=UPI0033A6F6B0